MTTEHLFTDSLGKWHTMLVSPFREHPLQVIELFLTRYSLHSSGHGLLESPARCHVDISGVLKQVTSPPDLTGDEVALAMAVLSGDREAALFLADKVLETYHVSSKLA